MRTKSRRECVLCGSNGNPVYLGLTDSLEATSGTWGFRRCTSAGCGLVWLDPAPVEADMGMAYKKYYTHMASPSPSVSARRTNGGLAQIIGAVLRRTRSYRPLSEEHRRRAKEYLDDMEAGRLLEVGCGSGSRLRKMRDLGWTVMGQDIDPEAIAVARETGLPVHLGSFSSANFLGGAFDAILMSHVIEHAYHPVEFLQDCLRVMRPGGRLVAFTPNFESYGHRRFGVSWLGLDPPRHLQLFTLTTLRAAAVRAGFHPVHVWTTEANAFSVFSGSLYLKRHGRYPSRAEPNAFEMSLARGFQYWAALELLADPNSGEECILVATAPTD